MGIWTGKKLWKVVDAAHAEAVASGNLRIGTLQSYADLENGRADRLDGGVRIRSGVIATDMTDPQDVANLGRLGVKVEQFSSLGKVFALVEDQVRETRFRNCWAFCATEVGNTYDPTPDDEKAIFEISDAEHLAHLMWAHVNGRCLGLDMGWIDYKPRDVLIGNSEGITVTLYEMAGSHQLPSRTAFALG